MVDTDVEQRVRIQKNMSAIKKDYPSLYRYLEGWPPSTHGVQIMALAERQACELLGETSLKRPVPFIVESKVENASEEAPRPRREDPPRKLARRSIDLSQIDDSGMG